MDKIVQDMDKGGTIYFYVTLKKLGMVDISVYETVKKENESKE